MMERQMRATDANAVKSSARFGATLNTAVQERLYVLVVAAFAAAATCAGRPAARLGAPAT